MSFELESFKRKATAPLARAITAGDLDEVKVLCKKYKTVGYGPDQLCNVDSFSAAHPLFLSIINNNLTIFKFLVEENKATIDLTIHGLNGMEGNDMTLLHFACLDKGKLPFVKYLLEKGAKVNAEDKWGWTPLHCAAFKGHKEIAMNLLVEKADVNALDGHGESPYDKALRGGHKIILKLLTCQGGSSNALSNVRLNSISSLPLKVTLVGSAGVGKTSILDRFLRNTFSDRVSPTFGGVTRHKSLKMKNCQYEMSFYDLGGHDRYRNIAPVYYRGSSVVIVVFDVNQRDTYAEAKRWVTELMSVLIPQQVIVLCGNKAEKNSKNIGERQVSKGEVEEFVKNLSLMYVETSAKSGRMVDDLIAYSVKLYNLYVGQYSQTEAPVMLKRETKAAKSHLCIFTDLRTGKVGTYKHYQQQLKDATKTGYMMKEGHFITNWKRRYFVLKGEALYYYREEGQPFPAGAISIRDATITIAETRFPHSFQVLTRQLNSLAMHEKYVIACESELDMKEWIAAIEHEKVRYLYERESIKFRIDSEIAIPTDPWPDPVLIECEGKALNFYKDGFYHSFTRYPLATYPFSKDIFVRRCVKNPKIFYLSDDSTFLLHLVDASESGELLSFLKASLPANTSFSTMSPNDYLSTFITAYEYACHRLRIPLCQPLLQAFAKVQGSNEPLTCLALSKVHLSSQDMEALFYALRWYPSCDELVLTSAALDHVSISILVDEIGLNPNLKSVDLSNNNLGEGATVFILSLLKTKIEALNLAGTDIGVGAGAILDSLSIDGGSCVSDLNLSNCQLGDSISESLVRMLNVNKNIHSLHLQGNRLSNGAGKEILSALKKNYSIRYLDISDNNLDEGLARNIAQLLKRNQEKSPPSQ